MQGIDANCFCELLHSTFDIVVEEFLMDRLFVAWQRDHEHQPLRLEPFVCGLSVFLRGTPAERAAFCFRVYDINADGYIGKDEMFALLKNSLIHPPQEEDPDEAVREWLDIMLRKLDVDGDGRVCGGGDPMVGRMWWVFHLGFLLGRVAGGRSRSMTMRQR